MTEASHPHNTRSFWALNLTNFFLAQIAACVVPFLNIFLARHEWRYDSIGVALAISGFTALIFQIPVGVICDRVRNKRLLLIVAAMALGLSYAAIPLVVHQPPLVYLALAVSGLAGPFFAPLLASLAIELSSHHDLERTFGANKSWNNGGNLLAVLLALGFVGGAGILPLFYVALLLSLLTVGSAMFIRKRELKGEALAPVRVRFGARETLSRLLARKKVLVFVIMLTLFHLANGPLWELVGLYMKHLGGSDVKVAWLTVMSSPLTIPVAWFAGKYGATLSRKAVFFVPFFLLPVRIFLYGIARDPLQVLAITSLDGVISGVYGVQVILVCRDLTQKEGGFNFLVSLVAMAPALGAALGSVLQGMLVQQYGFAMAFSVFTAIAASAAVVFVFVMPETKARTHVIVAKVPAK